MSEAITFVVCPCLMFFTITSLALGDASANHDLSVTLYTLSCTHTVVKHPACIAKSNEDQCNVHAVADHTFLNVLSCEQEGFA